MFWIRLTENLPVLARSSAVQVKTITILFVVFTFETGVVGLANTSSLAIIIGYQFFVLLSFTRVFLAVFLDAAITRDVVLGTAAVRLKVLKVK